MIDRLTFAPATEADSDRLSDIILGEPGQFSRQVGMRAFGIRAWTRRQRCGGSSTENPGRGVSPPWRNRETTPLGFC